MSPPEANEASDEPGGAPSGAEDRRVGERRSGDDRRQSDEGPPGEERREGERRSGDDRRSGEDARQGERRSGEERREPGGEPPDEERREGERRSGDERRGAESDEGTGEVADEPASAVADPRDRRKGERRSGKDRRAADEGAAEERRSSDRRQGDRRKSPDVPEEYRGSKRNINEYPLAADELEFINAINAYKQRYGKPFPTWSEVLHVVKALGYSKAGGTDSAPSES